MSASGAASRDLRRDGRLGRWRAPLLLGACSAVAWWLVLFVVPQWFPRFPALPYAFDMSNYYTGARVGLEHGWNHIYDLNLQGATYTQFFAEAQPFSWKTYFVSLPAVAWIMAPLALLPPTIAYPAWLALILGGWLAAWRLVVPARGIVAALHLLVTSTLFPVLFAFECGNFVMPLACLIVLAWWLLMRQRQVAAGLILVAIGLKPQVAILIPFALLAVGYRRAFVTWVIGSAALLGVELLSLGTQGIAQWRADLAIEQLMIDNQVFTLAYLTGTGTAATAIEVSCGVIALVAMWLDRKRGIEQALTTAILGGLLATSYVHALDHVLLIPAFWLYLRTRPPSWQYPWFGFGAVVLLLMGHTGPAPLLVFELGWLALCVARPFVGGRVPAPGAGVPAIAAS